MPARIIMKRQNMLRYDSLIRPENHFTNKALLEIFHKKTSFCGINNFKRNGFLYGDNLTIQISLVMHKTDRTKAANYPPFFISFILYKAI